MQNTASALHSVVGSPLARRDTDRLSPSVSWSDGLPTLTGKLITLRELVAADGSALLPLVTAPEVARFLSPPPQSLERFTGFIDNTLRERRAGRYAAFAIVPHDSHTPVGLVQIRQIEPGFRTAEWGIALGSEWWGRGIFQDVGEQLLTFAFETLGVHRLEARVAARNARGNGAVEKLGGVAEGLLRSSLQLADGTRLDQVLWSWLAEEWRHRRTSGERLPWVH
jgi:[ribosomal protein S5]-alanine N-acetyltransferase